jgi:hypothetical protein
MIIETNAAYLGDVIYRITQVFFFLQQVVIVYVSRRVLVMTHKWGPVEVWERVCSIFTAWCLWHRHHVHWQWRVV